MNHPVRIVKSTTEDCKYSPNQALTLHFEGAPTRKQILATAKSVRMAHLVKPDLESKNLRIYTEAVDGLTRCQIVD
jgi:hypothetical protein